MGDNGDAGAEGAAVETKAADANSDSDLVDEEDAAPKSDTGAIAKARAAPKRGTPKAAQKVGGARRPSKRRKTTKTTEARDDPGLDAHGPQAQPAQKKREDEESEEAKGEVVDPCHICGEETEQGCRVGSQAVPTAIGARAPCRGGWG